MTLEELYELIEEISGNKVSSLVSNQITRFFQEGYTYKEIARCVNYYYVILGNDISKIEQYGICIIPYFRKSANAYYNKLKEQQEKQISAAEQIKEQKMTEIEVKPFRRTFNKKKVDIDGL